MEQKPFAKPYYLFTWQLPSGSEVVIGSENCQKSPAEALTIFLGLMADEDKPPEGDVIHCYTIYAYDTLVVGDDD